MRNRLLDGAQRHRRPRCGGCCRWLVVGLALACVLVLIVQRMTLSVAVIPWSKECGWGVAQQQSILGAFFWGYLATMIPGALLGNRFTAHAAGLSACLVLSSSVAAATPLAGCGHTQAVALRVALGAAQGPMFPLVAGLVGQWVGPAEFSRANAFVSEGSNFGVLVAYPLASLLCQRGWRLAFVVPGLLGLPCLGLLLAFGSSTPQANRWISDSELDELALATEKRGRDGDGDGVGGEVVRVWWWQLLSSATVWSITLNFFTANWAAWVLLSELPLYLSHRGYALTEAGFASDLPSLANVAGSLLFALAADALIASGKLSVLATRRLMNGVGSVGVAVCLGLVPVVSSTTLVVGLLSLGYGLLSAANSGCFSAVFDVAPRSCGVLYAFANCVGMSQGILSPFVTAAVLTAGGDGSASGSGSAAEDAASWKWVWWVASLLSLVGAAVFQCGTAPGVQEGAWLGGRGRLQ